MISEMTLSEFIMQRREVLESFTEADWARAYEVLDRNTITGEGASIEEFKLAVASLFEIAGRNS